MDVIVSNAGGEPIYAQIVRQLKNQILNGELSEGEALPSIRSLAIELQISSITTKRAYEELEREGYIVTQVGRGSFVSAQNKELLREMRIKLVEEKLAEAVRAAKSIQLSEKDFFELAQIIYEEE